MDTKELVDTEGTPGPTPAASVNLDIEAKESKYSAAKTKYAEALNRPFVRAGNFNDWPLRGRLVPRRLLYASVPHALCAAIFLFVGSAVANQPKGSFVFLLYHVPVGDVRSLSATLVPFSLLPAALGLYVGMHVHEMPHPACAAGWMWVLLHVEVFVSMWTCVMACLEASAAEGGTAALYATAGALALAIFLNSAYISCARQKLLSCRETYERTRMFIWETPYPLPSADNFRSGVMYRDDFYVILKRFADEEYAGREDGLTLEKLIAEGVPDASGRPKDDLEGETQGGTGSGRTPDTQDGGNDAGTIESSPAAAPGNGDTV